MRSVVDIVLTTTHGAGTIRFGRKTIRMRCPQISCHPFSESSTPNTETFSLPPARPQLFLTLLFPFRCRIQRLAGLHIHHNLPRTSNQTPGRLPPSHQKYCITKTHQTTKFKMPVHFETSTRFHPETSAHAHPSRHSRSRSDSIRRRSPTPAPINRRSSSSSTSSSSSSSSSSPMSFQDLLKMTPYRR